MTKSLMMKPAKRLSLLAVSFLIAVFTESVVAFPSDYDDTYNSQNRNNAIAWYIAIFSSTGNNTEFLTTSFGAVKSMRERFVQMAHPLLGGSQSELSTERGDTNGSSGASSEGNQGSSGLYGSGTESNSGNIYGY